MMLLWYASFMSVLAVAGIVLLAGIDPRFPDSLLDWLAITGGFTVAISILTVFRLSAYTPADLRRWIRASGGEVRVGGARGSRRWRRRGYFSGELRGFRLAGRVDHYLRDYRQGGDWTVVTDSNGDRRKVGMLHPRYMHRMGWVHCYWPARLGEHGSGMSRIVVEDGDVRVLGFNGEAGESVAELMCRSGPHVGDDDAEYELAVEPTHMRLTIVAGSWLGTGFQRRLASGITCAERVRDELRRDHEPLPLADWSLPDDPAHESPLVQYPLRFE